MPAPREHRTVCVINLGCPKNLVDAEVMLGSLVEAGWRPLPEPEDITAPNEDTTPSVEDTTPLTEDAMPTGEE